jgi:hypothetical protein
MIQGTLSAVILFFTFFFSISLQTIYISFLFPKKGGISKLSRQSERNEAPTSTEGLCPSLRACESEIQRLLVQEAPKGINLNPNFPISAFTSVAFEFDFLIPSFSSFQITKKRLNAAFTSVSKDDLESSKESVDLSSISEIADFDHSGEIAEVRLNLNLCDFRFLRVQIVF